MLPTMLSYLKNLRTFNRLGSLSRHDRLEEPDSLYYKQSKTLLHVYDKNKEMKRKREFFDCGFNGNILRIELRFSYGKQDWKKRFGTETVLVDMLLNTILLKCSMDGTRK